MPPDDQSVSNFPYLNNSWLMCSQCKLSGLPQILGAPPWTMRRGPGHKCRCHATRAQNSIWWGM